MKQSLHSTDFCSFMRIQKLEIWIKELLRTVVEKARKQIMSNIMSIFSPDDSVDAENVWYVILHSSLGSPFSHRKLYRMRTHLIIRCMISLFMLIILSISRFRFQANGACKYVELAKEMKRLERSTILVSYEDVMQYDPNLFSGIQEEYFRYEEKY